MALLLLWLLLSLYAMQHPRDAFSTLRGALFVHGQFLAAQFAYPLFALLTRKLAWGRAWRAIRMVQAIAVGLILIFFLLLLLATPDVSGFTS